MVDDVTLEEISEPEIPSSLLTETTSRLLEIYLSELSLNSQRLYRRTINEISFFCLKDFMDIDSKDAYSYYKELMRKKEAGELKPTTIRPKLVIANGFSKFIKENFDAEFSNAFENIEMPKAEECVNIERIPSWEELDQVLTAAKNYSDMLFLICVMVAKMGIIPTKLLQLKRSDLYLDAEQPYIRVVGAYRKRGNHIVIPDDVCELLLDYIEKCPVNMGPNDVIFYNSKNKPLSLRVLDWQLEKAQEIANIEHPFSLRSLKARAVLSMTSAGVPTDDVCDYTGLSERRVSLYSKIHGKPCPADLTHIFYK